MNAEEIIVNIGDQNTIVKNVGIAVFANHLGVRLQLVIQNTTVIV
jgi:hypothetical protein